jgi:hypothetical protein
MPVTLRDLQRAMARGLDAAWVDRSLLGLGATSYQCNGRYQAYRSMIDRLVAKYGPNTPVRSLFASAPLKTSGANRAKHTSEVAPATSLTSQEVHGGDGASGEVPDGRSTRGSAADPRQVGERDQEIDDCPSERGEPGGPQGLRTQNGQDTADHAAHGSGPTASQQAEETGQMSTPQVPEVRAEHGPAPAQDSADGWIRPRPVQPILGSESAEEDATRCAPPEAGNDGATAGRSTRETSDSWSTCAASDPKQTGVENEASTEKKASRVLARCSARQSRRAATHHGGVYGELARHRIRTSLVLQARKVLEMWLITGSDDDTSQRWDYPGLAARVLTHRNPYPARRQEMGRPALLLLADVSGSCAGFSQQSLLVAKAIAALGLPGCDVVIVSHSNGCPEEVTVNNRDESHLLAHVERDYYNAERFLPFYQSLVKRWNLTHVIALGDHDAVEVYAALALLPEIQSFVWLDNYRCNSVQAPCLDTPFCTPRVRQHIRYVIGCKGAPEFLKGLHVALRAT